jgi:aerobic-type carbon monoxide dehydrogenase small subunit (CoxS/CutS family)
MVHQIHYSAMILAVCLLLTTASAFQPSTTGTTIARASPLFSTAEEKETAAAAPKEGYVPKWVKKKTLAEELGDLDFQDKGIKGTVSVVFQQGDETKTTMAMPGQPLRDVATQAGQFIKYGCGKGECGTCEAMCNGKWVRPCKDVVPVGVAGEIVVTVKEVAKKSKSSGKFFSVKSFFMGFYNNLLGMVGFVKYRQNAKKNWEERQEYEDLIRQLTLEKRAKRQEEWRQRKAAAKDEYGGLSP